MKFVEFPDEMPQYDMRGDAPVEYDQSPIRLRGDALDDIWWRGRQWAVTDYGIEALSGLYQIEWKRLLEKADTFGWPEHMSHKNWVDIDDFITAWLVGISLHSRHGEKLRGSISRSWVGVQNADD